MRLFGLIGQPLTHSFSASYFAESLFGKKVMIANINFSRLRK